MKILWVSARLIGPAASIVSSDYSGTSGGWIQSEYDSFPIGSNEIIHLCGSREKFSESYRKVENDNGKVYLVKLPQITNGKKPSLKLIKTISQIISEVHPDIIQLWGTETCIQDAVVLAEHNIPMVVFIQGLIGIHSRYRGGYITVLEKNYFRFSSIKQRILQYLRNIAFKKQASIEAEIIQKAGNVIVDSDFAKAYCNTLGENIRCYNRHLNPNILFFEREWKLMSCEKNTLFTVYGGSPDKGLHQLLKAVSILKNDIQDIKVYIPGPFNIDESGHLLHSSASSTYEKWMDNYIKVNGLESNICFVGIQSPEGLAKYIEKCNVYVNPSCMEVHALSLREAMAVGVPVISSLCGSVAEFISYGEDGFIYRYEEFEVLALLLKKVLTNDVLASKLGINAREKMKMYYKTSEDETLKNIYDQILGR